MRSVKAANSQENNIRAQPVIIRTCVERNETYQVVVQPMPKHDHLKCSVRFPTATIETTEHAASAANEGKQLYDLVSSQLNFSAADLFSMYFIPSSTY